MEYCGTILKTYDYEQQGSSYDSRRLGQRPSRQGGRHFYGPSRLHFGHDRKISPCRAAHRRRERRPARRSDGQFGGRSPQYRRRPRGLSGPREDQPRLPRQLDPAESRDRQGVRIRQGTGRERAFHGPRFGRRRALLVRASFQTLRHRPGVRRFGADLRALLHGRPRHRPAQRQGLHRAARTASRLDGRPDRHDRRPLLRHGPRQALGTREGRLRCAGQGRRRGGDGHGRSRSEILRCGGHRRVHQARCARRCAGTACRSDSSERSGRFLQLPQRPRQGADDRPHAGGHARRGDAHAAALLLLP